MVLKRQRLTLLTAAVKRGGCYAVDNLRGPDSAVAVRYSYIIYDGRSDPYSARNCHYSGAGTGHSGAEDHVGREIPTWNSLANNEGRTAYVDRQCPRPC